MSAYLRLNMRDAVKVGGTTLPGVMTGLTVSGTLEIVQDKLEASSTHITSIEGYTTATVSIDITLHGTDSEREAQIGTINGIFAVNPPEGQVKGGKANAMRVVNPHLDARRIRLMLFTRFDSRDGNEDDTTVVSLEFKEIITEQARLEKAAEQDAATNQQTGELELPSGAGGPPGADANPADVPAPLGAYARGEKAGETVVTPPSQTTTKTPNKSGQQVVTP